MTLKKLKEIDIRGKKVFLRVDFNVPLVQKENTAHWEVLDSGRIEATLPTIRYLLDQEAKVIIASHLGRPKGVDPDASLLPVAEALTKLLELEVVFPDNCIGRAVQKLGSELKEGQVLLLENLRFHKEEEANDEHFSRQLAALAEVYVTDAFGTLHRAHASTHGMVRFFREKAVGFLIEQELEALDTLRLHAERPFYAVMGGAKISDKIGIIESLLSKVDGILLGGGLALTFLKATGMETGCSKTEDTKLEVAKHILKEAEAFGVRLYLPVDHRFAASLSENSVKVGKLIPENQMSLDIGPETEKRYRALLAQAKTVFWNGPMGVFEKELFAGGTKAVAHAIAESDAFSVIGGGESVTAVRQSGVADQIDYLSTGGGASLTYLEGRGLPGLEVLKNEKDRRG